MERTFEVSRVRPVVTLALSYGRRVGRGWVVEIAERLREVLRSARAVALVVAQDGLITRAQLLECGLSPSDFAAAVKARLLKRHLPKIYEVAPCEDRLRQAIRGVTLWLPKAVVSHDAAAIVHRLDGIKSARISVLVENRYAKPLRGVVVRRQKRIFEADITVVDGFRVTTVERTLIDISRSISEVALAFAVDHAWRLGWATPQRLTDRLLRQRRSGRARCVALESVLTECIERGRPLQSAVEIRWYRISREHGLPLPRVQVPFAYRGHTGSMDFLYERERVVLETHGAAFHLDEKAFQSDSRRTLRLTALGYSVIPLTWQMLDEDTPGVVAQVRDALAKRSFRLFPSDEPQNIKGKGKPGSRAA